MLLSKDKYILMHFYNEYLSDFNIDLIPLYICISFKLNRKLISFINFNMKIKKGVSNERRKHNQ